VKIAIIGGAGKMGRWFAGLLRKEGLEVVISGRNEQKLLEAGRALGVEVAPGNAAAVRGADWVLLSVPIAGFEEIAAEVGSNIRPGQVVLDITSVKDMPVAAMHRHVRQGQVLGAHPMFGPGAAGLSGQNVVLTPVNDEEAALARKVNGWLTDRGARVAVMSPQEHDEVMAVALGLAHLVSLVAADTLLDCPRAGQVEEMGGITSRVLLTLMASVLAEDPEFYASLQMNLPGMADIGRLFQEKAAAWTELVAGGDGQGFTRRMRGLRGRFEQLFPGLDKAYERMYRIAGGGETA